MTAAAIDDMVCPKTERRIQRVHTVVYLLLLAHAVWVVLAADWPGAAVLGFLLAAWYDYRASHTLRRVRARLLDPAA